MAMNNGAVGFGAAELAESRQERAQTPQNTLNKCVLYPQNPRAPSPEVAEFQWLFQHTQRSATLGDFLTDRDLRRETFPNLALCLAGETIS